MRDKAMRLAKAGDPQAVSLARRLPGAWPRAQAMAYVARYAETSQVLGFVKESVAAAELGKDHYQRAALMAWPIRALIERGYTQAAADRLEFALTHVPPIEHGASRSEALHLLFESVFDLGQPTRRRLANWQCALREEDDHWRVRRNTRDTLDMMRAADQEWVDLAMADLPAELSRLWKLRFEAMSPLRPRAYFH